MTNTTPATATRRKPPTGTLETGVACPCGYVWKPRNSNPGRCPKCDNKIGLKLVQRERRSA